MEASHPGYDPTQTIAGFSVAPALTMTLEVTPTAASTQTPLTLTVQVYERGAAIGEAGAFAEISTPGGIVTVPLVYGGGVYTATFRPADLAPNLGGSVSGGQWQIVATADYYGGTAKDSATSTVRYELYLPLILRSYFTLLNY
jgi:hypothetical protein